MKHIIFYNKVNFLTSVQNEFSSSKNGYNVFLELQFFFEYVKNSENLKNYNLHILRLCSSTLEF